MDDKIKIFIKKFSPNFWTFCGNIQKHPRYSQIFIDIADIFGYCGHLIDAPGRNISSPVIHVKTTKYG